MEKYKPSVRADVTGASIQAKRLISSGLNIVQELLHADQGFISGAARIIDH
jgi:hypothetical protein